MDFLVLSVSLMNVMESVSKALNATGAKWLLGGSCGLTLQGVAVAAPPRDLDIYIDQGDVECVYQALQMWATDPPHFSHTDMYESCLSHYALEGLQVEVVGGFRVHAGDSVYCVEASYLYDHHGIRKELWGQTITLMPLAHEYLFNWLRNRQDRYEAIAQTIRSQPEDHEPVLQDLLDRNQFGEEDFKRIQELLRLPFDSAR